MDQEKRDRYEQKDIPDRRAEEEEREMEEAVSQKINWVEPEERYVNQGEFIGPNTYRTGKLDRAAGKSQETGGSRETGKSQETGGAQETGMSNSAPG